MLLFAFSGQEGYHSELILKRIQTDHLTEWEVLAFHSGMKIGDLRPVYEWRGQMWIFNECGAMKDVAVFSEEGAIQEKKSYSSNKDEVPLLLTRGVV